MRLEKIYQEVKAAVCRETGVDEESILHSIKEPCVDARYIMVHLLSQWMTDEEISRVTGLSRTCANKIRNSFQRRINKYSIRSVYGDILKSLPDIEISIPDVAVNTPQISHKSMMD